MKANRYRTRIIHVRLREMEYRKLQAAAEASEHKTLSQYIRRALLDPLPRAPR